jgi:hypothetical protein
MALLNAGVTSKLYIGKIENQITSSSMTIDKELVTYYDNIFSTNYHHGAGQVSTSA